MCSNKHDLSNFSKLLSKKKLQYPKATLDFHRLKRNEKRKRERKKKYKTRNCFQGRKSCKEEQ